MAFHPAVLATALLLASAAARAEDTQRDACTPDARRLCQKEMTNVARTTECLVAHKAQLTSTCRNVFAFAEPVADRTPLPGPAVAHTRPAPMHLVHRHLARGPLVREHRHVRLARRAPYHIPRFDQAEAEAEVHAQYRYRTPYLPYWVFP